MSKHHCPSCGSDRISIFYELENVPVHSVSLVASRAEALDFPRGDIALGACRDCQFIHNTAFDPERLAYYSDYESTQAYSSTFNAFHADLAKRLIQRYGLHDKELIEIGCGHGEFLTLLCDFGDNRGTGFDPAYLPGRCSGAAAGRTTFIKDYYSETYSQYRSDFLCCKMTLEHIQDTAEFVHTVRRSLRDRTGMTVFFQVPDATRILRESAFWDIYYEHCSYFTGEALQNLFRLSGFDVVDSRTEYDGQYLMIEARPGDRRHADAARHAPQAAEAGDDVAAFANDIAGAIEGWRQVVRELHRSGRRTVVWGGGSKAVAFLTTLGVRDEIDYAVDINPHKHGTFLAGTGQEVVAPEFLKEYQPNAVIVMNPVYCREIEAQLNRLGVTADLIPLKNASLNEESLAAADS